MLLLHGKSFYVSLVWFLSRESNDFASMIMSFGRMSESACGLLCRRLYFRV